MKGRTGQLVAALERHGMVAERCGRDVRAWESTWPERAVRMVAARRGAFPWRRVWTRQSGTAGGATRERRWTAWRSESQRCWRPRIRPERRPCG